LLGSAVTCCTVTAAAPAPEPQPSELRDLLAQCIEAIAAGGPDAAEPILLAHPQHGDALRERLRKLAQAGLLVTAPPTAEEFPERLGDFRLVRRLGAGGMGVVYLAVQESLGREVALKLVKPDQLYFPGSRERFRREVEAIARLHDPGIVGIHMVGEDGGIPFFAMERIVGATLTEALQGLGARRAKDLTGADFFAAVVAATAEAPQVPVVPERFLGTWVDTCLRIAEEMARALAHAHAQGVLHRDLKPSNVMVTPTGRVALLDFGLAQARGAARITRTGAQLGSLHYMAPEQVRGLASAIDERTDVYALGVVLYELLTLQLPFRGESHDEVARRILAATPERVVRRNSAVTWDVETVCFSAMDPDREQRYPSATALLRDLRNLLARRPIEARRPGTLLRLRRFAQRHRTLTAVLIVAGLAVVATPSVIMVRERELNAALQRSIGDRDREMARARNNVEVASQALNRVLQLVSDEDVDQVPDLRQFTEGLLQQTATHLDALFDSNPTEPEASLWLAETLNQAGNLRWRFRDFVRADAAFSRALQLLDSQAVPIRAAAPERYDLVRLDAGLELCLLRSREYAYRSTSYIPALKAILGDVTEDSNAARSRQWREIWGRGLDRLGWALLQEDPVGSESAYQRALQVRRQLAQEFDEVMPWLDVTMSEQAFLALPRVRRDREVHAGCQKRADEALQHAARLSPKTSEDRIRLASRLRLRGDALRTVDPVVSLQWFEQAISLYESAIEARPSRLQTRVELLAAIRGVATLQEAQGQRELALASHRRLAAAVRPLLATYHNLQAGWLALLDNQAHYVQLLEGEPAYAAERDSTLRALEGDALGALQSRPELATVVDAAAHALGLLARHQFRSGDTATGAVTIAAAIAHEERARGLSKAQHVTLGGDLVLRSTHVEILLATGQPAAALAALRAVHEPLPQDLVERIPGLAAVADQPGFQELLRTAARR
jgi:serine/threonine protein kinase